jgi:hypothetical protein
MYALYMYGTSKKIHTNAYTQRTDHALDAVLAAAVAIPREFLSQHHHHRHVKCELLPSLQVPCVIDFMVAELANGGYSNVGWASPAVIKINHTWHFQARQQFAWTEDGGKHAKKEGGKNVFLPSFSPDLQL